MTPLTSEEVDRWLVDPKWDAAPWFYANMKVRVLALLEERDSWRRQAGVEATCVGALSERAEKAEAECEEARREAKAQVAMLRDALGAYTTNEQRAHDGGRLVSLLADTQKAAAEHDARVAAEARLAALEEAANHVARGMVMVESPDRVRTCAAIVADLRALAVALGGDT